MNDPRNQRRIVHEPSTSYSASKRSHSSQTVRKRRRKSNMSLYYIMVAIIVAIALYVLTNFVFFRLDEISVTGSTYYARESIVQASTLREGDNLFRTDIKGIEERLNMLMVYADNVKVRRKLPSKIEIIVTEAVPKYNLEQDGVYYVVSESGKILENNLAQPKDGLMIVKGFDIKDTNPNAELKSNDSLKASILTEITQQIEKMHFDKIKSIDIYDRTDIKLNYDDKIEISIGSSLDIPYKLRYTSAVLEAVKKTYGEDFEGRLIYHSATSGMSAIANDDQKEVTVKPIVTEQPSEEEN